MASVSFEYFPPRNEQGENLLEKTVDILSAFQPEFQSVTYGAGGSSREGTLAAVKNIADTTGVVAASHLTYTGSSARDIAEFADRLWQNNIRHLVALRGDEREKADGEHFVSTAQFVRTLKRHHPFEIAVSCYPETHPLANSRASDIVVLKEKQNAGASLAISQFFFDNSVFYEFVDEARNAGVTIPILPGILPIYNFDKVRGMAEKCGASVPDFVHEAFAGAKCSGGDEIEVASELLKAQVHDLAIAGYESIHIYTLNQAKLAATAASAFLQAHKMRNGVNAAA